MDSSLNGYTISRDPVDQLAALQRHRPNEKAPVRVWAAWFAQQADLFAQIAARDAGLNLGFVADHYRRKAKELLEQHKPHQPWPGAATW